MKFRQVLVLAVVASIWAAPSQAQVLNRLKNKVEGKGEQKAGEAIDNLFDGKKKDQGTTGNTGAQNGQTGQTGQGSQGELGGGSGSPSNKGGGGLVSTPPDVKQNLADAETAYKKSSY